MEVIEAIYKRRSIRSYENRGVDSETVRRLLKAAVQAPSAMNEQPWAFGVFQGAELLRQYSARAKTALLQAMAQGPPRAELLNMVSDPHFNMFYDAPLLIVLYAIEGSEQAAEDCCLAGENLMLAGAGLGLATCPIGLAKLWLNLPAVKKEFDIPEEYRAVLPVVLGYSASAPPTPGRNEPNVLVWKRSPVNEAVDIED